MYKVKGVIVVLAILLFASLTPSFADQHLAAAWQSYQHDRAQLQDSFVKVDAAWAKVAEGWLEIDYLWNQLGNTWQVVENDWAEAESARALVASTLHITLYDSSPRITRWSYSRSRTQEVHRTVWTPWVPEASHGSWDELSQYRATLDAAWASANHAWAELEGAWDDLSTAHDEIAQAWIFPDQAFQQISVAFDEIDRAWNPHH